MTKDTKLDLLWWLAFLRTFNGTMPIANTRPSTSVSIDSCKLAGGGFYQGDFVYTPWSQEMTSMPINYLEVLSLEPAAYRWAHLWRNKRVYVHCDNQCAVTIINKGSSRNPTVMSSLRRVFWLSVVYNFRIRAVYYPGISNRLSDCVSRLHEPGGVERLFQCMTNLGFYNSR